METFAENPELAQDILQLVHQRLKQERQEHQRLLKLRVSVVVRYGPSPSGFERLATLTCRADMHAISSQHPKPLLSIAQCYMLKTRR